MSTYLERHMKCHFKPGDIVEVFRKAKSHEDGWENGWTSDMDNAVGHTGIVISDGESGVQLDIPEVGIIFGYPYTCIKIR